MDDRVVMKAIKRLVQLLILLPIGIVLVSLAVANRHSVILALDPFSPQKPVLEISIPLYVVIFGALIIGIFVGGFMAWLKQGRHRRTAREQRREAKKWRQEADRQQKRVEKMVEQPDAEMAVLPAAQGAALPKPKTAV